MQSPPPDRYFDDYPEIRQVIGGRGSADAHQIKDLCFLHRYVRKHGPQNILEIGCGDSTIVMAHAAKMNADIGRGSSSKIFGVDANQDWLDALIANFPDELSSLVELSYSPASIKEIDGQLCHIHDKLPDIEPRLIYLDGPSPRDVRGNVNGLSFATRVDGTSEGHLKVAVSADILLYEWILRRGAVVIVDGRSTNVRFLRRNLKREWSVQENLEEKRTVFTLVS